MATQLDGKFATETQVDLAAVKSSLEAAEQDLARAEGAAPAAALRVHTGKAEPGDTDLLASLPDLRSKADALRLAFEGAQQAEANRLYAKKVEAANAQRRACAQHLARARKAGEKAASALSVVARCYSDMAEATRAAAAVAPPKVRSEFVIEQGLAPERVARLFVVELARCLRQLHVQPPRSWVMWEQDVQRNGQTVPLTELLGLYIARIAPLLSVQKSAAPLPAAETAAPSEISCSDGAAEPILSEDERLIAEEMARMKRGVA